MTTTRLLPIRNEAAYERAVAEVRRLWGSAPGTAKGDRLDVLMILVEAYETQHHAVAHPDPIEAIKARMQDLGLARGDLGSLLNVTSSRVSELLTRRRPLTLEMIRTLAVALTLPEACLVQRYDLVPPVQTRGRPRTLPPPASRQAA